MEIGVIAPSKVRAYYKARSIYHILPLSVAFVVLVSIFSAFASHQTNSFLIMLVGDVVLVAAVMTAYIIWEKAPVRVQCQNCNAIILANTPWVCGYCKASNNDANAFPFIGGCRQCKNE